MSDFYVYLDVPEYLEQWIKHSFGHPVELVKDSPEARLLNELQAKLPSGENPDTGEGSNVTITIPYFKGKNPDVYNYLHKSSKLALIESFCTLFDKNLFNEITALDNGHIKRATRIYIFMEKHGIDEKHWDTVAQRAHRLNQKYGKKKDIKVT